MFKIFIAHSDPKLVAWHKQKMQPHFSVDSAQDGLTALRKIRLIKPHVILSDDYLPKLSGLALLKFVRTHTELGATPFIFISHKAVVEEALNLGANDWLVLSEVNSDVITQKIYYHLKLSQSYVQVH